jgi:hypothetical protein
MLNRTSPVFGFAAAMSHIVAAMQRSCHRVKIYETSSGKSYLDTDAATAARQWIYDHNTRRRLCLHGEIRARLITANTLLFIVQDGRS